MSEKEDEMKILNDEFYKEDFDEIIENQIFEEIVGNSSAKNRNNKLINRLNDIRAKIKKNNLKLNK